MATFFETMRIDNVPVIIMKDKVIMAVRNEKGNVIVYLQGTYPNGNPMAVELVMSYDQFKKHLD